MKTITKSTRRVANEYSKDNGSHYNYSIYVSLILKRIKSNDKRWFEIFAPKRQQKSVVRL